MPIAGFAKINIPLDCVKSEQVNSLVQRTGYFCDYRNETFYVKPGYEEYMKYQVLSLLGVEVPTVYLVQCTSSNQLFTFSRREPGYRDLFEYVSGTNNSRQTEATAQVRRTKMDTLIHQKTLNKIPVRGLFENIAIFAFLGDRDAIGYSLKNAGLIKRTDPQTQEEYYQLVKIDPEESDFTIEDYDPELIKMMLQDNQYHHYGITDNHVHAPYGKFALGWPIFRNIRPHEVLHGLKRIASVTQPQLRTILFDEHIPEEAFSFLVRCRYFTNLCARLDVFKSYLESYISQQNHRIKATIKSPLVCIAPQLETDLTKITASELSGIISNLADLYTNESITIETFLTALNTVQDIFFPPLIQETQVHRIPALSESRQALHSAFWATKGFNLKTLSRSKPPSTISKMRESLPALSVHIAEEGEVSPIASEEEQIKQLTCFAHAALKERGFFRAQPTSDFYAALGDPRAQNFQGHLVRCVATRYNI